MCPWRVEVVGEFNANTDCASIIAKYAERASQMARKNLNECAADVTVAASLLLTGFKSETLMILLVH